MCFRVCASVWVDYMVGQCVSSLFLVAIEPVQNCEPKSSEFVRTEMSGEMSRDHFVQTVATEIETFRLATIILFINGFDFGATTSAFPRPLYGGYGGHKLRVAPRKLSTNGVKRTRKKLIFHHFFQILHHFFDSRFCRFSVYRELISVVQNV